MRVPARVGVAGATGAVGLEMLAVREERGFPIESVRATASGAGDDSEYGDGIIRQRTA